MSTTTRDRQRHDALLKANAARVYAASFKRALTKGERRLIEVVGDDRLTNVQIGDLVMALPSVGKDKTSRALRKAGVSHHRPVGRCTEATVWRILAYLPERHR